MPDPPIALATASFLASQTAESPLKSNPATPGITPAPAGPQPTNPPPSPPAAPSINPSLNPVPNPPASLPDPPVIIPITRTLPIPPPVGTVSNDPPLVPITTLDGSVINVDPSHPETIVIGDPNSPSGRTLSVGDDPIVIGGSTVRISPSNSAIVLSGQTTLLPVTKVGDQTVYLDPSRPEVVVIGNPSSPSQTLSRNGDIAIISGTTISLAATAAPYPGTSLIDNMVFTRLPDGSFIVNGRYSLKPGDPPVLVDGHSVSLSLSGGVIVDGLEQTLESTFSNPPSTVIQGITFSLSPGGTLMVNGKYYMKPGDPSISVDGHTVGFSPSSGIMVDGVEHRLDQTSSNSGSIIIQGISFSLAPEGGLIVNGQYTLKPGGPSITINGHTISFSLNGAVTIDGVQYKLDSMSTPNRLKMVLPDGTTSMMALPLGYPSAAAALMPLLASLAADGMSSGSTPKTSQSSAISTSSSSPSLSGSSTLPISEPRSLVSAPVPASTKHTTSMGTVLKGSLAWAWIALLTVLWISCDWPDSCR